MAREKGMEKRGERRVFQAGGKTGLKSEIRKVMAKIKGWKTFISPGHTQSLREECTCEIKITF